MGLGSFLGAIAPIAGGLVGSLFGPAGTAVGAAIGGAAGGAFFPTPQPVSMQGPMPVIGTGFAPGQIMPPGWGFSTQRGGFFQDPIVQTEGVPMPQEVALPAAGVAIMGLTRTLALTISRLAARLGITVLSVAGLGRVGSRIWRSLAVFARRHPNISLISMLTALGLTIEEASEFIAWGSTRKRRRRGGISGRDLRIAKRTIRRISSFQHDLAHLRAHVGGFRRQAVPRRGGVSVVRAG